MAKKQKNDLKIYIRNMERHDIPKVFKWLMSESYRKNHVTDYPLGKADELKNQLLKELALNKFIYAKTQILIATSAENILVGAAFLKKINWQHRNLELQIFIPQEFQETNISVLVTNQVFDYIFGDLNMHKVYTLIPSKNEQALKNHKKHGHEPEAVLNDYMFNGQSYIDLHVFAFYKKDIIKKKK